MSSRSIKWILLALCVLTLPVPFIALESGTAPPLRLIFVGSLILGIVVQDPDMVAGLLCTLYLGQGLLWSFGLYFACRFAAGRVAKTSLATVVVAALAVVMIAVSFFPIYLTPMSSSGLHSNILGVFD